MTDQSASSAAQTGLLFNLGSRYVHTALHKNNNNHNKINLSKIMTTLPYLSRFLWFAFVVIAFSFSSVSALAQTDFDDEDDDDVTAEELMYEDIPIDEAIFLKKWTPVPFNRTAFDYSTEEITKRWNELMIGIRAPYPSAPYLEYMIANHPELVNGVTAFSGDYEDFSQKNLEVWRLFLRGDFQQAREEGLKLGAFGLFPAMFAQVLQAQYLAESQHEKYMLLQDVANRVKEYLPILEEVREDPIAKETVAFAKLGYAYSLGRIAEESPVAIVVARRYINKIKDNADDILALVPDHPLGHAFRAGVDANIMRRVGRATGRITYGARGNVIDESFTEAFEKTPNIPILNYEYANALIYQSKKRHLNEALSYYERATKIKPTWSMDALDVMYAHKRLAEIKLFEANYRSFRTFERQRRRFSRVTDRNLTNVSSPILTMDMLNHPEKYKLK